MMNGDILEEGKKHPLIRLRVNNVKMKTTSVELKTGGNIE